MPAAFITGATGFLGRHIVDVLREQGWTIYALVRNEDRARKLIGDGITFVQGDLLHVTACKNQLPAGINCIFHVAADTSTWKKDASQQAAINIGGTESMLQLCQELKADRFVHVSSTSVYGIHEDTVTEASERKGIYSWVSYARTKAIAERRVLDAVSRGIDAVILNPTHIVGRYDDHNWSRMIQMLNEGTLPGVPPGAGNFANGRAVAEAIVTAFTKGQKGENYILGGPYATMREFLSLAAQELGKPAPGKPTPAIMLKVLSRLLSVVSAITGKRPMITPEEAYFAAETVAASCEKAVAELDYREVPLEQSVKESIEYLREQGRL
ncbi:NAD-dependent epimerase/dehydratase family protein [Kordiimonas lipolytica]|uniref:NAD-dependent epimerase/dehydratase family protein n=1 Tax=Kordiimonas lipolytica TaxID=1662421 RepID=A0ABV8U7M3_9PROT|nr:NAD-dependent epimerase/dehydratase family protein [Kordiimonas lipolytica]